MLTSAEFYSTRTVQSPFVNASWMTTIQRRGRRRWKEVKVKGRKGDLEEGRSKEGAGNVNFDLCDFAYNGSSH